ncbi:MAG: CAP domain-containing protein [Acidobacteriota bacterium]|nr:MAG: CAP domain-containing protein [Acidobacteriota bacterium]
MLSWSETRCTRAARFLTGCAASCALLAATLPAQAGAEREWIPLELLARVQNLRAEIDLEPLTRRAPLDDLARARAGKLARAPQSERLSRRVSIDDALASAGLTQYRRAREMVHLQRHHPDPVDAALEAWRAGRKAWSAALGAETSGVGAAAVMGDDGWLVVVVILVEDRLSRDALDSLEDRTFEAINRVRQGYFLAPLIWLPDLGAIARIHSQNMGREGFFDHVAPDGRGPADRLRRAGQRFLKLSENIVRISDDDDAIDRAVEAWLSSSGHRRNILDAAVTHTGVGVAIGDDGALYFTQLFVIPVDDE